MRRVIVAAALAAAFVRAQAPETLELDLSGAMKRARDYNPQFMQAKIGEALAKEDRVQAKAAMLPTVTALNQVILTQSSNDGGPAFVSADGTRVYNEQLSLHSDVFSFERRAEYQRAVAAQAAAKARADIATRGLYAVVVQNYYGLVSAQRREANARRSLDEARKFLDITDKQERGGEVAKADVIKARLQSQQRQRELADAEAATQKARIALAVMVFPDLQQAFKVVDDLSPAAPLQPYTDVQGVALSSSPDLRAAEAGIKQASAGIAAARSGYYPVLSLDYFYGLNATVFALRGPDDRKNLGSSLQATATVPVWNWGATRSKVRQAELQHKLANFELSTTRRELDSALSSTYLEARIAASQIESLRASLDLSEESLRLTVLRYQAGEAVALEVVDAQSTLVQARNAYDDGLARYRVALAALDTLTGRF